MDNRDHRSPSGSHSGPRRNDRSGGGRPSGENRGRGRDHPAEGRTGATRDPRKSERPGVNRPDRPSRPRDGGFASGRGKPGQADSRGKRSYDRPAPYGKPRPSRTPAGTSAPAATHTAQRPATPAPASLPATPVRSEIEPGAGLPDRLEGRNPILEAIKAGRTINKLWVTKRSENPDPALGRLVALAREAGAVIMEVDRKVLDAMSTTHGHQGVIAQVAAHEYIELTDLLEKIKGTSTAPFLLILAEIQDSYNLGSILRIADAAGVQGIIIPMRRSVGLDAAVAKASAGAIEHVPVARVNNLVQTITELKKEGFWIAGTDADGKTNYREADWQGPLAIIIGSEGEGLSPSLKRQCDFQVAIPMQGKVNSLNAAVAAGIITFEAATSRRTSHTGQDEQPASRQHSEQPEPEDNGHDQEQNDGNEPE